MIFGFDVSKWQDPSKLDWKGMADAGMFLIARATYGARYADPTFVEYANRARAHGIPFGAYCFYRQVHSAEEQLALFEQQLRLIGDLHYGEFFPVLDMETNQPNGDGPPNRKLWNAACDQIGDAWKERYGGAILYMSAAFPGTISPCPWIAEMGYRYWIAHYGPAPGAPSEAFVGWDIHQFTGSAPHEFYAGGKAPIDQNVARGLTRLLIAEPEPAHPPEPHREVHAEGDLLIPWVTGLDDETRAGLEEARKADNEKLSEDQS